MSLEQQILTRLHAPAEMPEIVTRVHVALKYSASAVAEDLPVERLEIWEEMAEEVTRLLGHGFLSRPVAQDVPARVSASLTGPDELTLIVETPGAHANLVVLLIRLLAATHHSPDGAFQELLTALDGDTDAALEVFGGMIFERDVALVTVQTTGPEGVAMQPFDARVGRSRGAHLPASGLLDEERVIEADVIRFQGVATTDIDPDLEDAFLSLSGMQGFVPFDFSSENEPGEEEFFAPASDTLAVNGVSMEQVFLFEMIACLNGGDLSRVAASVGAS